MKKSIINTFITTAFIASLGLSATGAMAGPDSMQLDLMRKEKGRHEEKRIHLTRINRTFGQYYPF